MAIYTHLTFEQITEFISIYELGDELGELQQAEGIAEGVENTNYLLTFSARKAILTLFEKRVSVQDLPFFMELMRHLAFKGISCPLPYISRNGKAIHQLAGRSAVMISFMQGQGVTTPQLHHLHALGMEVAKMHLAVQDFSEYRTNALAPHRLSSLTEKIGERLNELQAGLYHAIAQELTQMQQWPQLALPRGIIHADLFPDNVFFNNEQLSGIIDFYFACEDYLAYELAICLNAWCFEKDASFNSEKAKIFFSAYEAIRPLHLYEKQFMPLLARGAAIRFLLTRAHDWFFRSADAVVIPKDPMEYLQKWQFHCRINSFNDYTT